MQLMAEFGEIKTMRPEEAREWLGRSGEGEVVVLDVRQPQEYRSCHLPGAIFIPLPELPDRTRELDPSKTVLTYCRSGNRSRAAAALLLTEGFSSVYNLEGGITAWNGGVATGEYGRGLPLLEGRKTAEQLIALAWALEEGSRSFYEKAVDLTSDTETKDLFRRLAEAEEKHKANILQAYRTLEGRQFSEDFIVRESVKGVMEGGVQVDETIAFLKGEEKTLQDLIEVSMQVETNALDLYVKMSREITNESAAKVFSLLIGEEKRHLMKLGRLLEEKL